MATAPTFTATGNKSSRNASLPDAVFAAESISQQLLHHVYTSQQSRQRTSSAHTKTRGEVRGGGRKARPQKYTGRARAGSIRNPIWRGGGVTFGPTGVNARTKQVNKRAKRTALKQSLSLRASEEAVMVIEALKLDGTTKSAQRLLDTLPIRGKLLCVSDTLAEEVVRSLRNIPDATITDAASLNTVDVLDADTVLLTRDGLASLQQRLEESS